MAKQVFYCLLDGHTVQPGPILETKSEQDAFAATCTPDNPALANVHKVIFSDPIGPHDHVLTYATKTGDLLVWKDVLSDQ